LLEFAGCGEPDEPCTSGHRCEDRSHIVRLSAVSVLSVVGARGDCRVRQDELLLLWRYPDVGIGEVLRMAWAAFSEACRGVSGGAWSKDRRVARKECRLLSIVSFSFPLSFPLTLPLVFSRPAP
jgi:hypothetical protein